MSIDGCRKFEQSLQRHVDGRRRGEVSAAHHARNPLAAVVDDRREVIGDRAASAEEHRVPHLGRGVLREIDSPFIDGGDAPRAQPHAGSVLTARRSLTNRQPTTCGSSPWQQVASPLG